MMGVYNILLFAILVFASVCFGAFAAPRLVDSILRTKRREITETFNRNLDSYLYVQHNINYVNEKRIKEVDKWVTFIKNQELLGKIEPWMAKKLLENGVIEYERSKDFYVTVDDSKWAFENTIKNKILCAVCLLIFSCLINASMLHVGWLGISNIASYCLATVFLNLLFLIALCDFRAMVIPYQLCLIAAPISILLCLSSFGFEQFIPCTIVALIITGLLYASSLILSRFGVCGSIGAGDLRIIPWICLGCGTTGALIGLAACYLCLAILAVFLLIKKKANRKTYLPMSFGLVVWLIVGFGTIPFLIMPYITLY